jgi:heat-inducible transcriptional repressor
MESQRLTERQKLILGLVVQEFVDNNQPVSSHTIVKRYGLDISSATVRNELSSLDDLGLLRKPHKMAGRVPTEEGYRYFVGELMRRPELPAPVKHMIVHQFYQARQDVTEWMRLAASVLAHQSQAASLVTAPVTQKARFKHLELILTTGRQVLMVLVLMSGKVIQQMLVLKEPVSQNILSSTALKINQECSGHNLEDLATLPIRLNELGQDIFTLILNELDYTDSILTAEVFHDGWTNMLAKPEFAESGNALRALRVLEERPLLEDLLSQTVMNIEVGVVQVLIGGEGNWEELSDCSLVLSRYGKQDLATGILGVLGPMRMAYRNTISTVHFVAGLLSDMVTDTMADSQAQIE